MRSVRTGLPSPRGEAGGPHQPGTQGNPFIHLVDRGARCWCQPSGPRRSVAVLAHARLSPASSVPPERRRNRPLSAQIRAGGPRLNSTSCAATAGSAVEDAGVIESQARAQKSGGASPHVKPEQRKLRARISGARAQEAAEAISAGCFRTSASGELRREYRAR